MSGEGLQTVLEAQPVEGLRVIDRCKKGSSSVVFQGSSDLVPHLYQEVGGAAPLDPPVLVALRFDLFLKPVQNVAFVNFRRKKRTRNVP